MAEPMRRGAPGHRGHPDGGRRAGRAAPAAPSCSRCRPARVEELCAELAAAYEADDRGFVLARVAGGYRFQSHPDLAPYVERFVLEGQSARLSAAALETLAIVAYKQPVSRAQVAAIRGVNVDGVMRTLQQRGYIEEVGRDPGPGQAVLYGTTRCSSSGSASTRSTTCRRSATSCPAPRWSRRSSRGSRDRRRVSDAAPSRRASACRRCWPGPASAAGGRARS